MRTCRVVLCLLGVALLADISYDSINHTWDHRDSTEYQRIEEDGSYKSSSEKEPITHVWFSDVRVEDDYLSKIGDETSQDERHAYQIRITRQCVRQTMSAAQGVTPGHDAAKQHYGTCACDYSAQKKLRS